MPTATMSAPAETVGSAFRSSPVVERSIRAIVDELKAKQSTLTGARPPRGELHEGYAKWLARSAEIKGRPNLYPYIGSGVGNGALVELEDGSVKWDLINGIGVHMFGHGDPAMVEAALRASLSDTVMQGNLQFNRDSLEFADFLLAEAGRSSRFKHCFVSNSGCMVNESALKVCQQRTNAAPRVIAFQDCCMGRSTTMAQIGDGPAYRVGVPLNVQVDYLPFYDPALGSRATEMVLWHLEQYLHRYPKQHSCLIVELIQGEGGFHTAPREFFVALLEMARKHGVPVWDDEVQTFGRTESMFAFERLGLGDLIDVVTIGKMSQACACLYTAEINPKPGLLSGTFTASATAFGVGLAALTRLRDGGYYGPDGKIARLHAAFRKSAEDLVRRRPEFFPAVRDAFGRTYSPERIVSGHGGMMRLTPFGGDKDRINKLLHRMFDEGVIAFSCGHGPYHLRFLPPVGVMRPEDFTPVFEIVERAMAAVAAE
jgi:4-aminobutyrate aminotransferase-like enzyme